MKKLLALLLLLSLIFSYTACSAKKNGNTDGGESTETPGDNNGNGTTDTPTGITVVVPEYKDYGRDTVDFNKLVYSRPNIQSLIDAFAAVTAGVEGGLNTVDANIESIRTLEVPLETVRSMYSLAQIYNNSDSSVAYWQNEYEYISTNYPRLTQAIEDLLVACARSEDKVIFEQAYFGYSLDEYVDGGIYTDDVVELMAEEARLESEYSSLSTANVKIVYNGTDSNARWEGTVDEVIEKAREYYQNDDRKYETCLVAIDEYYQAARESKEQDLLIELIKVRRLIADELGYSSYSELAYDGMGYDYTAEEMFGLLSDIGRYVTPVMNDLYATVLQSYFISNREPAVSSTVVINTLYEVYSKLGGDYKDAYSYMLQHGLYNIADYSSNRYGGAFTAYIDTNNSPFIFMTSTGFIDDFNTLSHEFGHFLDGYINYGDDASLAISEISSQALELLTLTKLKNNVSAASYVYLEYYTMFTFLYNVLMTQSCYSAFEHMVYELEYDEITKDKLEHLVDEAYVLIFGEGAVNLDRVDLSHMTIAHTILYPFYVESYVTSGIVSLDIFFAESARTGNAGDGFALYEALINRTTEELDFVAQLEAVGIDSPFLKNKVKEIADNVNFQIVGKHYYTESDNYIGAA